MSYRESKAKYALSAFDCELAKRVTRMQDFDMLDYEIGEIEDKPTAEQVERILDEFNDSMRDDGCAYFAKLEGMRDAISSVMGRAYLDG